LTKTEKTKALQAALVQKKVSHNIFVPDLPTANDKEAHGPELNLHIREAYASPQPDFPYTRVEEHKPDP
jgi:hypothetical protein